MQDMLTTNQKLTGRHNAGPSQNQGRKAAFFALNWIDEKDLSDS